MPVRFTDQTDGDLAVDGDPTELSGRRSRVVDAPWTWLHQVHGSRVVTVTRPGEHAGAEADAAVTAVAGAPLAVHTADCAPVVFTGRAAVGVAHVGWRGLVAGVLENTVEALTALGETGESLRAEIGPCIRARCYEFSPADLEAVECRLGVGARATTAWGAPALDLPAGIALVLAKAGIDHVADAGICTACSPRHWSFRARRESGRQAAVAWLEP